MSKTNPIQYVKVIFIVFVTIIKCREKSIAKLTKKSLVFVCETGILCMCLCLNTLETGDNNRNRIQFLCMRHCAATGVYRSKCIQSANVRCFATNCNMENMENMARIAMKNLLYYLVNPYFLEFFI